MKRPSLSLAPSLALLLALSGCGADAVEARPPLAPTAPPVSTCPTTVPTATAGKPLEATTTFEGLVVTRVCFVGGTDASRALAQKQALLEEGQSLKSDRVRADLETLMKLGPFDDAAAYGVGVTTGAGGVVLVYAVRERPLVADFAVEGAKAIPSTDPVYPTTTTVNAGAPFDPRQASTIAHALRDLYRSRGYAACRAVVVTDPVATPPGAPPQVHVRVKVDEGVLWHLVKLDIKGNKKLTETEIRKIVKLKVGDPYIKEEADHARDLVAAALYDRGYVSMSTDLEEGPIDAAGNVPLTLVVDEGDVHTVKAIHVTGLGAPLEKELLERVIKARPRQVFSRTSLVDDIARVKEFFKQRGQAVNVLPLTEIDPKAHTVELTLSVDPSAG